jgi:hypothetical protein
MTSNAQVNITCKCGREHIAVLCCDGSSCRKNYKYDSFEDFKEEVFEKIGSQVETMMRLAWEAARL